MKNFVLALIIGVACSIEASAQVTFTVHKNLPAPTKEVFDSNKHKLEGPEDNDKYFFVFADTLATNNIVMMMYKRGRDRRENSRLWANPTIAYSFGHDNICLSGSCAFTNCILAAYADHRPLILSPDMLWTFICQGFSNYVNQNPKKLRQLFVSHDGTKVLTYETHVPLTSPSMNWNEAFDSFEAQIAANTKGNIAKTFTADFTTSGSTERIVSQMTLMNAMKGFFEYRIVYKCGIPYITLEGTPADWKKVMNKAEGLRGYGIDWWIDELKPILTEFYNASNNNVNEDFWKGIVKTSDISKVHNDGCGKTIGAFAKSDTLQKYDGWFLKLMPYTKDGKRMPSSIDQTKNTMNLDDTFVPQIAITDFIYDGPDSRSTYMEMWSGFFGFTIDSKTNALRPKLGWLVRKTDRQELEKVNIDTTDYDKVYKQEDSEVINQDAEGIK